MSTKRPPKRFMPGFPITSLYGLMQHAETGGWFFAFGPRPQHSSVIMHQQLHTLLVLMSKERLRYAVETPEYQAWKANQWPTLSFPTPRATPTS
jgi:hypothetical protein